MQEMWSNLKGIDKSKLFLAGFDRVPVLASHYFHFRYCHHLVRLHFEGSILDNECPDVVT